MQGAAGSALLTSFRDGTYNPTQSPPYNNLNTVNGSVTTGPNGTITMDVPLTDFGASPGAQVTNTWADTHVLDGLLGSGLFYTAPTDRAPDTGYGALYTVGGAC